jgi:hypothetical protein
LCFRCELNGHFAEDCKAVCVCIVRRLRTKLLTVVITYGLCRNELLFYEIPASDELKFKHNSGKWVGLQWMVVI